MSDRHPTRGFRQQRRPPRAISQAWWGLYPESILQIVEDYLTNDPNYCTVMHADGAGNEIVIGVCVLKETGDLSFSRRIGRMRLSCHRWLFMQARPITSRFCQPSEETRIWSSRWSICHYQWHRRSVGDVAQARIEYSQHRGETAFVWRSVQLLSTV